MSKSYKEQVKKKIYTNGNPSVSINVEDITYIEKVKNKKFVIIHLKNKEEHIDTKMLTQLANRPHVFITYSMSCIFSDLFVGDYCFFFHF